MTNNKRESTIGEAATPAPAKRNTAVAFDSFISVAEAARRLDVSTKTIRRKIADGSLLCGRLGGRVIIPEAAYVAFTNSLLMRGVSTSLKRP